MMGHYLNAFLMPEPTDVDVELFLNHDPAAVTAVARSLADSPPAEVRSSHPDQRYQVWTAENHHILVPERGQDHAITVRGNRISVTAEQEHVAATIGVRVVRQLIMRAGEAHGGRAIHAGAVALNGHGVLVGGHPGAGKTSILTRLVEDHSAAPVSNDRTVLVPSGGDAWRAVGVPLAWRFTPEGIDGSPRLADALANRTLSRGSSLTDGKVELTPLEVSQVLDSPATPTVHITRSVVLSRLLAGHPQRPPETRFLRRHLDFGVADFFADDWLGIRPQLAQSAELTQVDAQAWWTRLAATLPVQAISWTDPAELARVAAAVADGQP
ncbi:MAG: hypothetical protein ACRDRD_02915 [Pseudonocardiaceae bacterium]